MTGETEPKKERAKGPTYTGKQAGCISVLFAASLLSHSRFRIPWDDPF
jgi:hypothetical protein